MSATGRGERGGEGHDYFATPAYCVDWLLRAVDLPGGNWLEPSAGDGAIIRAVNARRTDVRWSAVEIREDDSTKTGLSSARRRWFGDFLLWAPEIVRTTPHAVVLGNPPYCDAAAHVAKALECAPTVAFLLRLNFLGSAKRLAFWRRHPADVYVLSERPSFGVHAKCGGVEDVDGDLVRPPCGWDVWLPTGSKAPSVCPQCGAPADSSGSDATEYAWFVWGQCGTYGRVQVLGPPETGDLFNSG